MRFDRPNLPKIIEEVVQMVKNIEVTNSDIEAGSTY